MTSKTPNINSFNTTHHGKHIDLYELKNANGMRALISNYGGKIVLLEVPDRNGKPDDMVLGYNTGEEYIRGNPYFGAAIGRYANRIAGGIFQLDGKSYNVPVNNPPNHLHGGTEGFNAKVWQVKTHDSKHLELEYISPDGEENYPGNLKVSLSYALNNSNELKISYRATTDKPTIINLSHHSFFNLAGHDAGSILKHRIMINADYFTPTDENLIPTGKLRPVSNSPMDLRQETVIADGIFKDDEQLKIAGGYDHNFVLNKKRNENISLAARIYEENSGRQMEVYTDQAGMQFYTGNSLSGEDIGKTNRPYKKHSAFCLETQNFPDAPNKAGFPSPVLRPGEEYRHLCIYAFGTRP
jgi:aldose 1-epimerase